MKLSNIQFEANQETCEIRAQITSETPWVLEGKPFTLWYRFPSEYAECVRRPNADPFLAALLVPAMVVGESLQIEGPASAKLWMNLPEIQSLYRCWYKKMSKADVSGPSKKDKFSAINQAKAVFFSLGVDSWYSLLKNVEQHPDDEQSITHLINVLGFDIYLWDADRYPPMLKKMRQAAEHLGKKFLPVVTNLREFTDKMADWPDFYHGAALASIGLFLEGYFEKIYLAATQTYDRLWPMGSHPVLDPMWSTESLSFVHDGCEATRLDKIRFCSRWPIFLDTLRVCTTGKKTSKYNCGECEKCLRTMIGLHIAGALDRCKTLPHEIRPELFDDFIIHDHDMQFFNQELLENLGVSDLDLRIKRALSDCLDRSRRTAEKKP